MVATPVAKSLSPSQQSAYVDTRARLFRGTIAVAIIYAVVSLLIILFAMFSELGAKVLTAVYPFTLTLVIGMILVILTLVLQVTSWMPEPEPTLVGKDICPDYWTVQPTSDTIVAKLPLTQQPYAKMQCISNSAIYTSTKPIPTEFSPSKAKGSDKANDLILLATEVNTPLTTDTAEKLSCQKIYPQYMAQWDSENWPGSPNAVRCEWAKTCGVPWSGVCPATATIN